jgi:Putative Actinobacterial Holin-X, holin superfamily III
MVSQTKNMIGHNSTHDGPIRRTVASFGSVLGASIDLASLQLRLFKSDAKAASQHAKPFLGASVFAFGLILSSLPLVGLGLASLLAELTEMPVWVSQLSVGGVFLLVAGVLLAVAWSQIKGIPKSFERSQREANENLAWFRETIDPMGK